MKKTLPYILFATIFHGACLILLVCSPTQKKQPKLLPFKEKLVTFRDPPHVTTQPKPPTPAQTILTKQTTVEKLDQKQTSKTPIEKKKLDSVKKIPIPKTVEKEKPAPKPQTEDKMVQKNTLERKAKLKAIANLTKTLSQHLDDSNAQLADLSLPKSRELTVHSSLAMTQEEELCQLLREYIVLPFSREVRVKLILTPQGTIHDCVLLSEISEAEKQLILMRIYEIPFKKFLDKYKISKNIVFHIKLLSNES
ncbi:energy transducer [Chlamydia felis Fe/C-56]|uniref:Energy transducer n=1 Tax=Chlamydia felis (strain Fe/C-56) TaxID=264202 RepID=Q256H7_CHLFF|nr:inclusion-associated protein [Chlamydia felis]BAE80811.1 energy transducer [Chlamydia felis Fe/C-56]